MITRSKASANAASRRRSRSPRGCRTSSNPSPQPSGSPSHARTRCGAAQARTAARVSSSARPASCAASPGGEAGCSRVLTRPGTGSLASTITARARSEPSAIAHRAPLGGPAITAAMSRTARQAPSGVPVTLDRPGRRSVVDADLGDPPAGVGRPDHGLGRVAGPPVAAGPAPSSGSRRAARIGPSQSARTPVRRRTRRASARLASRSGQGMRPSCDGPRGARASGRTPAAAPARRPGAAAAGRGWRRSPSPRRPRPSRPAGPAWQAAP